MPTPSHSRQSYDDRLEAVFLHKQRNGYRTIAKKLHRPVKTVRKWIYDYKTEGSVARKCGSGVPTKCTPIVATFIKKTMKNKTRVSLRKTKARLASQKGINVSHQSIGRYARKQKLQPFKRPRRPLLNAEQKQKRCKFVKTHVRYNWKQCVFSDESLFELYPRGNVHNDVVWAESTADVPPIPQVVHSPSIMVWGGISIFGKTPLWIFDTTEKALQYQQALKRCLMPATKQWFRKKHWELVEDQAKPHTAKSTRNWLAQQNIHSLLLPAKSPDVNLIEKVWARMKDEVSANNPKTVKALKRATRKAWNRIDNAFICSLFDRLPDVLHNIVLRSGATVD